MAFDPTPSTWFSGIVIGSSSIEIPYTALSELNQSKATNDVREIIFNFCESLFDVYDAMATADRPTRLSLSRSASLQQNPDEDIITKTYQIRTNLVPTGLDMLDE